VASEDELRTLCGRLLSLISTRRWSADDLAAVTGWQNADVLSALERLANAGMALSLHLAGKYLLRSLVDKTAMCDTAMA
jgi:hypothetical protein